MLAPVLQMNHDPLLNEEFLLLGGGVGYAINEVIHVTALVRFFVRGYNTRDSTLLGVGVGWNIL
jgi:hypothetical protein